MSLVILSILILLSASIVTVSIDSICIDKEKEAMKKFCKIECKCCQKLA